MQRKKIKNNKKPTAKERLTKSYESWAKANLTPNTKKEYLKDNIRREWEVSDEYGKWFDAIDEHGLNEPADNQLVKIYSSIHTKLEINIHQGPLPISLRKH